METTDKKNQLKNIEAQLKAADKIYRYNNDLFIDEITTIITTLMKEKARLIKDIKIEGGI